MRRSVREGVPTYTCMAATVPQHTIWMCNHRHTTIQTLVRCPVGWMGCFILVERNCASSAVAGSLVAGPLPRARRRARVWPQLCSPCTSTSVSATKLFAVALAIDRCRLHHSSVMSSLPDLPFPVQLLYAYIERRRRPVLGAVKRDWMKHKRGSVRSTDAEEYVHDGVVRCASSVNCTVA